MFLKKDFILLVIIVLIFIGFLLEISGDVYYVKICLGLLFGIIVYSYIQDKRNKCNYDNSEIVESMNNKIELIEPEVVKMNYDSTPDSVLGSTPDSVPDSVPIEQQPGIIEQMPYDYSQIKKYHHLMGGDADNFMCNRMKYSSMQPQMSKDIRARHNKYKFQQYYEQELREQENRDWWETDELDDEMN